MAQRSPERAEFLSYITITAIEGGIGYWSYTKKYKHEGRDTDVIATIIDRVEEDDWIDGKPPASAYHEINNDVIARGIAKILAPEGGFKISSTIRGYIASANVENDAGMVDADAADCIVQAAIFGELVYG